jgi:hypothetical protein
MDRVMAESQDAFLFLSILKRNHWGLDFALANARPEGLEEIRCSQGASPLASGVAPRRTLVELVASGVKSDSSIAAMG